MKCTITAEHFTQILQSTASSTVFLASSNKQDILRTPSPHLLQTFAVVVHSHIQLAVVVVAWDLPSWVVESNTVEHIVLVLVHIEAERTVVDSIVETLQLESLVCVIVQ